MNEKLLVLKEKIENKKKEMRTFIDNKDLKSAENCKNDLEDLKKEYDLSKVAFEDAKNAAANFNPLPTNNKKSEVGEFLNSVRGKSFDNAMVSKDNEAGGYTVPEDIQTDINKLLEAEDALQPLVRVTKVNTEAGARTFQKRSGKNIKGFQVVDELGQINQEDTPQFDRLLFKVLKYAGFFVASNEVLHDSDANLKQVLIDWIGNMSRVTRNRKILEVLNKKEKTAIVGPDEIKKALTVTLDPAFRNSTVIITNQDGFHYLDTLKYPDGRYMLQETIAFKSGYSLMGRQVITLSNNDLPSVDGKAPVIMGDLKEAIEVFDRKSLAIKASEIAGKAWATDSVEWRAIERFDVVMRDDEAFVYGQVDVSSLLSVAKKSK